MSHIIPTIKSKEKKKKLTVKGKRKRSSKKLRHYTELLATTRRLSEEGLLQIKLSSYAQLAVNCVIGQHISVDKPWILVSKKKIVDDIELRIEGSEFLPLEEEIRNYPEETLLIGLKKEREPNEEQDLFYICGTVEVKEYILHLLEENELAARNNIRQALEKEAGHWITHGSEEEINDERIDALRPLFIIEIECDFPIFKEKRRFSLSLAYPESVQFVEILPTGGLMRLVYKRVNSRSVQAAATVSNNSSQTIQLCQMNQITQVKVTATGIPHYKDKNLLIFLNETMHLLSNPLLLNAHINIYTNDYESLKSNPNYSFVYDQTTLKYIRDVNYGRNKYVSALVWHPRISGLVAVAYAHASRNCVVTKESPHNKRLEFNENVVLIWCYSRSVQPKLILHADREIVSLCFCPYNVNILVGGCANGQIVIWDLIGKLERAESTEMMLTQTEVKHRIIVESHTKWMWFANDVTHLKPKAISNLLTSHRDAVTAISWLSSNYECTIDGNVLKREQSKETPFIGGQFITCGADGLVLFWDLSRKMHVNKTAKFRKVRLPELQDPSPFSELNNRMFPIFKIVIDSPYSYLPLTDLLIPDQEFMYEIINPETAGHLYQRTYFKSIEHIYPKKFDKTLTLITGIGTMCNCTWAGHEYTQGNLINSSNAKVCFMHWVHDAPIHTCAVNPIDNNILLTISSKIFAIWNTKLDSRALIWRKSSVRYNCGVWSENNIGMILMFRADSKIELWDILVNSKSPSSIVNETGFPIINNFVNERLYHVTKETYFKTDKKGIIALASLMPKDQERVTRNSYSNTLLEEFSTLIVERREALQKWVDNWKKRHLQPEPEEFLDLSKEVVDTEDVLPEPPKKVEIFESVEEKWRKKELKQKLLSSFADNKKINLGEIEKHKYLIMNKFEEKVKIKNKLKHVLKSNEKIFESNKKTLLESYATERRKRSLHGQQKDGLMRNDLKEMFMQSYYETEKNILPVLKKNAISSALKLMPCLREKRLANQKYAPKVFSNFK